MSLTSGTRLGSYEIGQPIGAGGMGEVYRARDTKLHRDVAIKLLPGGGGYRRNPARRSAASGAAERPGRRGVSCPDGKPGTNHGWKRPIGSLLHCDRRLRRDGHKRFDVAGISKRSAPAITRWTTDDPALLCDFTTAGPVHRTIEPTTCCRARGVEAIR